MDKAIENNLNQFVLWYKGNILIQAILILAALAATVTASVTTRDNAERMKKFTITLTALTAALTSFESTFHVKDNVNTFIDAEGKLVTLEFDYLYQRSQYEHVLRANVGKDPKDKIVPREIVEIQDRLMKRYVEIEAERMRAWASIGQQSAPANSPPSEAQGVPRTP